MVSHPPLGIASRALTHRFSNALSIWFASHRTSQLAVVQFHLDLGFRPDRAADEFVHSHDDLVHAHRLRRERLLASEREQTMRQRRRARDAAPRTFQIRLHLRRAALLQQNADHAETAADRLQHVVEVVRDAAGKLPDRFEFFALAQTLLDAFALLHFLR